MSTKKEKTDENAVKAEAVPAVAEKANPYSEPTRDVVFGQVGNAVRWVQWQLGIKVNGEFGNVTLAAVRAFQKKKRLEVDGVVNPVTRNALKK